MGKKVTKGKHWELVRPGEPEPAEECAPPERQRVRVALEKRSKGKVVTVVWGLALDRAETRALAKTLKALCGTGGTAGEARVELQGDHRELVRCHLSDAGFRGV